MSKRDQKTIWCRGSTHQWFTELADGRDHDTFLRRLLTLWSEVSPNLRERYQIERKTDDKSTRQDG